MWLPGVAAQPEKASWRHEAEKQSVRAAEQVKIYLS